MYYGWAIASGRCWQGPSCDVPSIFGPTIKHEKDPIKMDNPTVTTVPALPSWGSENRCPRKEELRVRTVALK